MHLVELALPAAVTVRPSRDSMTYSVRDQMRAPCEFNAVELSVLYALIPRMIEF